MVKRGIDEDEGIMSRRNFLRGAAAAGTAGFLGVAGYGTVASLLSPERPVAGEVLDSFVYVRPQGVPTPTWYEVQDLVTREARLSHFDVGQGANVVWRPLRDQRGNIIPVGLPGLLIRLEEEELSFPAGYNRDEFTKSGLIAVFNCCTHACCRPGWQLIGRNAYKVDLGYDNIYCPCHDSQYNPRRFTEYQHDPPPLASGATFLGVHKEPGVGPAPRGMPLIPLELDGDRLVGVVKDPEWYHFLDFKAFRLEAEE